MAEYLNLKTNGKVRIISGNPTDIKTRVNRKKEEVEFIYFAVAIPKNSPDAELISKIKDFAAIEAEKFYGKDSNPVIFDKDFAWKIEDGDDQTPRKTSKGTYIKNCDRPYYPGNYIIKLSTSLFKNITYSIFRDGITTDSLNPKDDFDTGDWIRLGFSVCLNEDVQNPGIYINPQQIRLEEKDPISYNQSAQDFWG